MSSMNQFTTRAVLVVLLALTCFVVPPNAPAVSPPPDGGYPGGNTAEGQQALLNLTTGTFNTAIGWLSLATVETGELNTAVGAAALLVNTADGNTAIGTGALLNNTIGFGNTANGTFALVNNITGNNNTAVGRDALSSLMNGNSNTAIGRDALLNNVGNNNVAVGRDALLNSTSGESNVAVGRGALANSTISDSNLALGIDAGNQVITASNVICIGHTGADVSDTTWIGNVFGVTTQTGTTAPVIVSNNGQLGTVASSERFKKDIVSMQKTSEAILALRPVTFHYKTDTGNTPQFGLIAEEVAKVNPALVLADREGKPYTVRYDVINAMLLNEFLKEHRTVNELKAMIARQQKAIEALTAGLQKVSAQLELSKPVPQTVLNDN
jgi:trimeric autotransporter adhesin